MLAGQRCAGLAAKQGSEVMHVATMLLGIGRHQLNVTHVAVVFAVAAIACLFGFVERASAATTERVSVASDETQGDDAASGNPIISRNGRYVLFLSSATNLVPGDTNGVTDVFVRDTQTGATERVSVAGDGSEGNGGSGNSVISADGRYVAFISDANNLVVDDTNDQSDLFLRDRVAGTTQRVSVSSTGDQANDFATNAYVSANGRYVGWDSPATNLTADDTDGERDVFVRDLQTGTTERVSVPASGSQNDDSSNEGRISDDGRYVVFSSEASTIVAGDGNGAEDVFVRDRVARATQRVSVGPGGIESDGASDTPAITPDGATVTFDSFASNLVSGDANGVSDVFARELAPGATERVSLDSGGGEANAAAISPDISADGRFVAFRSGADNLVAGDTNGSVDNFRHDRTTNRTVRVSVATDGTQADGDSFFQTISGDGTRIAFRSAATNLVAGDTNGVQDVFLREDVPPPPPDPYADAVAPSTALIVNGSKALGAPDGQRAKIVGVLGGHATFDMGAGEEGTGDLTVSYGGIALQWTTTVSFLDARGAVIASGPMTFALGIGPFTRVVAFRGRTPYRYVRFSSGLLQTFGLDAVRAASIVS